MNIAAMEAELATVRSGIAVIAARLAHQAVANPDDELIALCAEAERCEARIRHIDEHATTDEACNAACDAWNKTFKQVAGTPALTLAGVRAKANVVRLSIIRENIWCHGCDTIAEAEALRSDEFGGDRQMAQSLCRDILALAGAA